MRPAHIDNSIAIVGMAGRFPGAADVDTLWRNLRAGVESIQLLTPEELEARGVEAELVADRTFVPAAAMPDGYDCFDAAFFGYTARQAELMDPQHRLLLECAWHAMENAGYGDRIPEAAVGVFAGATLNTYLYSALLAQPRMLRGVDPLELNIANGHDFLTTRVSYKLNLTGPSHVVQSACSTSLVAVHVACQSLLRHECDMALAGGVSVNVTLRNGYRHLPGGMSSPDGHCRAFDAAAQGTVFGSGVALVALKRLADALTDRDTVFAVIRGSAVNNDGSFKVGYTAPSIEGQTRVIAEALANAEVDPAEIGYIEAHGTGTALGDPIEVQALTRAMGLPSRSIPCAIGSIKTNVGHLDAAAGVTGLIKTVLMLRNRTLVPTLHVSRTNPELDLDAGGFVVNATTRPWESHGQPRRAAVSAFGVGGTNAHVVLEEPPESPAPSPVRAAELLIFSAKTAPALDRSVKDISPALTGGAGVADIAYTLATGRRAFGHRRALSLATDDAPIVPPLDDPRWISDEASESGRQAVFLFPGQGAQRPRMASRLYRDEPLFREHIDECARLLEEHLAVDLREVLRGSADGADLNETALLQPVLFAVEHSLARLWQRWGVQPSWMLGHSLGEYVAACLAGVFSLEDALRLVAVRGRLMQRLPPGVMLSVPLGEDDVRAFLSSEVQLAAINAPMQCVVSGTPDAIGALERRLAGEGIMCARLRATRAFHSAMMDPILERFTREMRTVALNAPSRPFVSNVTGLAVTDDVRDPSYWVEHLRAPVRFADGLHTVLTSNQVLFEIGPGDTLTNLARRNPAFTASTRVALCLPRTSTNDLQSVLAAAGQAWVSGVRIDWHAMYAAAGRRHVPLPGYAFDRQRYWIESDRTRPSVVTLPLWRQQPPLADHGADGAVCLIIGRSPRISRELADALRRRGARAIEARADVPACVSADAANDDVLCHVLEPLSRENCVQLSRALAASGVSPTHIVFLAHGFSAGEGLAGTSALASAFEAAERVHRAAFVVTTSNALAVTPDEDVDINGCWASSFAASRHRSSLMRRIVDVDASSVDMLAAEILGGLADAPVALRHRTRWVQVLEPPASSSATITATWTPSLLLAGMWSDAELITWREWSARLAGSHGAGVCVVSTASGFGALRREIGAVCQDGSARTIVMYFGGRPRDGSTADRLQQAGDAVMSELDELARALDESPPCGCVLVPAPPNDEHDLWFSLNEGLFTRFVQLRRRVSARQWSNVIWRLQVSLTGGAWLRSIQEALGSLVELVGDLAGPIVLSPGRPAIEALPASQQRPQLRNAYVPPRTALERQVADVWGALLGIANIGMTDHFFELGGDSLTALHVAAKLQEQLRRDVPVSMLYEAPTVRGLAGLLQEPVGCDLGESERRAMGRRQFQSRTRTAR